MESGENEGDESDNEGDPGSNASTSQPAAAAGRRQHGPAVRTRERASEGDLAITGANFPRMVLADVHIVSTLAPSRLKEWNTKAQLRNAKDINYHMNDAAQFKRLHYAKIARNLTLPPGRPRRPVDVKDPLACIDLEMVPVVMTPLGNIGADLDRLLHRLATQTVDKEKQDAGRSRGNEEITTFDQMRVRVVHNRYSKVMAVALAQAVTTSFSAIPQRVNVDVGRWRDGGE